MNNKENDKLIAEFMGIESDNAKMRGHLYECPVTAEYVTELEYRTSWDWLMTVVGKIRTIPSYDGDKFGTDVTITADKTTIKSGCYGNRKHGDYYFNKNFTGEFNTREATYKSVVEFINHYNRKPIK
mgnify:CR=1 FL=1